MVANSAQWRADEALARIHAHAEATISRNRANAAQVAEWEAEEEDPGRGNDYAPNFWDLGATAEKLAVIENILTDTQHRHSRPNQVFFLEASDLCWMGL